MKKYTSNTFWMMVEQAVRMLASVLIGIYVARYLGPEDFGTLSYAMAISAFIMAISRMGMDAILVRELVKNPGKELSFMGTAFWLMFSMSLILYVGVLLYCLISDDSWDLKIYLLIITAGGLFSTFLIIDYFYQSRLQSKYPAITKTIAITLVSIFKLTLIFIKADLMWFVIAAFLDHFILAALLTRLFLKKQKQLFFCYFSTHHAKQMLQSAFPMILSAVAVLIYMRIDQIMIKSMLGVEQVGIYTAGIKIYEAWIAFPYVLTMSLLPALTALKKDDPTGQHYLLHFKQLFSAIFWISIVVAIFVTLISKQLISLTFGIKYLESVNIVNITMWTAVFTAIGSVSARYFNIEKMEKKIAIRTFMAAILNIILNFFLIPQYGIEGAAISTLICTIFSNYLMDWFDRDLKTLLKLKHQSIITNPFKSR